MKNLEIITSDYQNTHKLGKFIGEVVHENMVFLLDGDLGAGKTTLTQGIAKGLEISKTITSPTFNILKIYQGRMPLYHIDAYRLEGLHQDLGFDEFLDDQGLTVIEWSQYVPDLIPGEYLRIQIQILEDDSRKFTFFGYGKQYEKLLDIVKENWVC